MEIIETSEGKASKPLANFKASPRRCRRSGDRPSLPPLYYNEPFLRYRGRHVTRSDRRNKAPAEDFKTVDRFWDGRGEGVPDCLSSSPLLEGGEASIEILCEYTGISSCRVKLLLNREIPQGRSALWMTDVLEFDSSSTLFGWV